MPARDKLLKVLQKVRINVMDLKLGFRQYTAYVRRATPSDGRGGIGATWTNVDTIFPNEKPRARPVTERDVVRMAGRIRDEDWVLERITPIDSTGTVGASPSAFDLNPNAPGQKVFIVLDGKEFVPNYAPGPPPSGGGVFTLRAVDFSGNLEYKIYLRPEVGFSR